MHLLADGEPHQLMPGGMEVDRVDAVAEAVVRPQFRPVPVRLPGEQLHMGASDGSARSSQLRPRPVCPECVHDPAEGRVRGERVVIRQGRRLVQHLVRGVAVAVEHGCPP